MVQSAICEEWERQEKEREAIRRKNAIDDTWKRASVPTRHAKPFEPAPGPWTDRLGKLKAMLGSGFLVALYGDRGTGKTQLAACLIHAKCESGSCLYSTAMDIFIDLKGTYRSEVHSERSVLDRYARPTLLVVDEIHERGETAWEDRMLTHIIDTRYREMRDTLLISNQKKDALVESLGPSIASRLQETGGLMLCDWPSFRGPAA